MIKTILVDVDGVIANFTHRAITALAGSDKLEEIYANWPEDLWDIAAVLGIDRSTFWKTVDTAEFWSTIPPFDGAYGFMRSLHKLASDNGVDDIMFATSSGGSFIFPACRTAWLRAFCKAAKIPSLPVVIFQNVVHKAIGANHSSMIIEDNDLAISTFREKGGHAVLVPRLGNKGIAPADGDVYAHVLECINMIMTTNKEERE